MKYSIEQQDAGIVITVEEAGEREVQLVDSLRDCHKSAQQGCNAECSKIAALEQSELRGAVVLRLVPRAGERLDMAIVGRCLQALWKVPCSK